MLTSLKRLVYAGMFLLAAGPLAAQVKTTPSAEGSTITNTATAKYTDANDNVYADVTGSAVVTVGFFAAPNPTSLATITPASPSTNNTLDFTITNSGNGLDSIRVSALTLASGLTFKKYQYNSVDYATLALLNAAIDTVNLAAGAALPFPVVVVFDVDSLSGGASLPITLTAASMRTPATSYAATTNVEPPAVYQVAVTPDDTTIKRIVTNAASPYTFAFSVKNTGNASNTFTITYAVEANGTVVDHSLLTASLTLAAGQSGSASVQFKVADGSAPDRITVTATSGAVNDAGSVVVTAHKAALSIAKSAHRTIGGDSLVSTVSADAVVPGTGFFYKLLVSNATGSAVAAKVVVTDELPAALSYVSGTSDVGSDWTFVPTTDGVTGRTTVVATLNPVQTIAAGSSRFVWLKVQIATTPATVVAP